MKTHDCGQVRGADHGSAQHATEDAAVGDAEGTTFHIRHGHLVGFRFASELGEGFFNANQVKALDIADDRHDETSRSGSRKADVDVVAIDDLVLLDGGIHRGNLHQGVGGSLEKDGLQAEFAAVDLLEDVLVLLSHGHETGHVDLVEGGESGLSLLSALQVLGDGLSHAGHLDPVLASACNCRGSFFRSLLLLGSSSGRLRSLGSLGSWGSTSGRWGRGRNSSSLDLAQEHAHLGGLVGLQQDLLEDARSGSGNIDGDLVGLDGCDELALLHVVAHFVLPLLHGSLGDALGSEFRGLDFHNLHVS
mmetsp:Transcript_57421/g.122133  ORF Transcript_57421/g.122133 Transcript_57421/m.122133 type:complete len:305 (-) Transcript_57421:578-1492(-)